MRILTDLDQLQLDRIEEKLDKLLAKKKPKPRAAKKTIYDSKFQQIWEDYPSTYGSSKIKAYAAYNKRLSETKKPLELKVNIHIAVINYAAFIKATGRYPKLVETFLGPSMHYLDDWTIPKPKEKNGQPEIFSQSHQDADFSGQAEKALDPVDPYAELK